MLLAIETSGQGYSVALADPGPREVVALATAGPGKKPVAARLMPALDGMLRDADCAPGDISIVAISIGPGSFTGLRSGLTIAKTLCHELDAPLVPVPTLLARAMWHLDNQPPPNRPVVVAVDARRRQVYGAIYQYDQLRPGGEAIWRTVYHPECVEMSKFLVDAALVLGDEGPPPVLCCEPELLEGHATQDSETAWQHVARPSVMAPTAREIALLALSEGDCFEPLEPEAAEPTYVRPPDAKVPAKAPFLLRQAAASATKT